MTSLTTKIYKLASMLMWIILSSMIVPTMYVVMNSKIIILEWSMMNMMSTPIMMNLILDPIGMMFSCTVLLISANVLSFSSIYMMEDKNINRFTIIVLMFISSMNFLIFIPHMMILLLGWDGLGLVSFLLVIYYQNHKSLAAGLITALSNRIGDAFLLISIALTLDQGHWSITNMLIDKNITFQTLLIIGAAMTKSAQMPFSSWLPAAMAAPTPVSALVHSSTLVTAGVFLLIRFYPFLSSMPQFNSVMLLIGISTMLMAGMSAITECDMKKIIALSTLSQLGMMTTSIGYGLPYLTFFHMTTHALFKALLFIGAGTFINFHYHSQDLRWMGNLSNQMPITSSCITISNLALCGFPFMAGFYSKDLIIEMALKSQFNFSMMLLTMISVGLTALYSMRFMIVTVLSPNQCNPWIQLKEHTLINSPMIILSIAATMAGAMLLWVDPVSNSLSIIPFSLKMMPTILMLSGVLMGFLMSTFPKFLLSIKDNINHFSMCSMWFLVPLSTQFMMKFPMNYAHLNMKSIDQGWLEIPQLMHSSIKMSSLSIIKNYPKYSSHMIMSSVFSSVTMMMIIMF